MGTDGLSKPCLIDWRANSEGAVCLTDRIMSYWHKNTHKVELPTVEHGDNYLYSL